MNNNSFCMTAHLADTPRIGRGTTRAKSMSFAENDQRNLARYLRPRQTHPTWDHLSSVEERTLLPYSSILTTTFLSQGQQLSNN